MTETETSRTRGRPRKFDVDDGVATALALFARYGYDAVSIGEICKAAGITPTSLYAAYVNKYNLFRVAMNSYAAQSGSFVGTALAAATGPDDLWSRLLSAAADQYTKGPEKGCPVLDGVLGSRDADVQHLIAGQIEATRLAIAARLDALGDPDADGNALALLTIMRGLSAAARSGLTPAELAITLRAILAGRGATPSPA